MTESNAVSGPCGHELDFSKASALVDPYLLVTKPSDLKKVESEELSQTEGTWSPVVGFENLDGTRLTMVVPKGSTLISLGAGSEKTWEKWRGSFAGVTVATQDDIWMGSRGVCVVAGHVPSSEDESGSMTHLVEAAEAGEKSIAWAEAANAVMDAAFFTLFPKPAVSTVTGGMLKAFLVGYKTYRAIKGAEGAEGELESGLLHLHGKKEVLISTPGSIATGAVLSNVMLGAVKAEVVSAMTSEVKGLISAEVMGGVKAGLIGFVGAEVVARWGVEVMSRSGEVKVQGRRVVLGSSEEEVGTLGNHFKQAATKRVAIEATDVVTAVAGEGAASLTIDEGGEIFAQTESSYSALLEDKLMLRSGGGWLEMGSDKVTLSSMPTGTAMPAALGRAERAFHHAVEDAKYIKSQALAAGLAYLGGVAGLGASLIKAGGKPTAVGVAGDTVKAIATTVMLASAGANFIFDKAVAAAEDVFDSAVRVARKAGYTIDETMAEAAPSKMVIEPTSLNLSAPTIDIKAPLSLNLEAASLSVKTTSFDLTSDASVSITVGTSKISLTPAGIEVDAGAGLLTLTGGGHSWKVTAAGVIAS
jgi:hypothetical protein